jgi:hypothetical protein
MRGSKKYEAWTPLVLWISPYSWRGESLKWEDAVVATSCGSTWGWAIGRRGFSRGRGLFLQISSDHGTSRVVS